MNRGHINIIIEEGKTPLIEAQLVDNNILLTKSEMAHLFGCFYQKIDANIRSIFKNRLLIENEVSYTHRYTDKGIEKQIDYYGLEVLIFLSYRIETFQTKIFRQFLFAVLREHFQRKETEKCTKLIWYFRNNQNYWLN